ncbi:AAA family ATPase [Nanoarchaeota archaeon]
MQLKKIHLKNIRSYRDTEIEFPPGSTLLSGDIGSGKTSILLAIEFALFGLQPGQRGSFLLRNGELNGGVKIEIEIDNQQITIERTLKKSKTISQDYAAITIDNEKKELSVTELKNKVLELLNYPTEFSKKQNLLYKFTVYTPQEEMKQIILQDPETRINTLRHVFGIDKYKKILENTSILLAKIREEKKFKEALTLNIEQEKLTIVEKETELETRHYNLISIEKELFTKKEIRNQIEEERDQLTKKKEERQKLQQEIEKTKIMISTKNDSVLNNTKRVKELEQQIQEFKDLQFDESKIIEIESQIKSKKENKSKLSEIQLEINSKIRSINFKDEESKKLEKQLSNLESCPTCLQTVDALYRANVLNKIHNDLSKNKNQLQELEQEKTTINQKLNSLDSEISSLEKQSTDLKILKMKLEAITEKQQRLEEIQKSNNSLVKDIELLKQHNELLSKSALELSKYENLYEEKQNQLNEALKEERIADIKVAELKKEIEVFSKQIEELKDRIKKSEQIQKELEHLVNLETWLNKKFIPLISYIEKNVMIKLKTEFSKLFREWFLMLVSENFDVTLSDDFTPVIEQRDYEIDYKYLSGGERTAIALAYRLSLNQVINSVLSKIKTKDLVILDEPTDGFSDTQLDKMREVLEQLNVSQLIIVSHEQKIEGFVENVLRFKKENGVSMRG